MVEQLAAYLAESQDKRHARVLPFSPPEERLNHWKSKLKDNSNLDPGSLWKASLLEEVLAQSNRLHDPRYAGHQVAVPLPQLAWLQAATALLNNGMAIDEMGPASSPMEEAVMQELAKFMGLGSASSGILCHGGTLANRMRYPLEVFSAVRDVWPDDKPIGVRVSATDWVEGGWTVEECCEFAKALKDIGCDYICASSGGASDQQKIELRTISISPVGSALSRMPYKQVRRRGRNTTEGPQRFA